jgi:hypothetical protein
MAAEYWSPRMPRCPTCTGRSPTRLPANGWPAFLCASVVVTSKSDAFGFQVRGPVLNVSGSLVQRVDQQVVNEHVATQRDAHRDDETAVFRDDTVPERLSCRVKCRSSRPQRRHLFKAVESTTSVRSDRLRCDG